MTRNARTVRARRAPRGLVAIVVIGAAGAGVTVTPEAAANPPAPTNWPDPPAQPPKQGAKPMSIQKHDGGCFVHYDGGGNAKADCPPSLANEPPGESIEKNDDGTCRYMMTISWSGGSSGPTPCPDALGGPAAATTTTGTTATTTNTTTSTSTATTNPPPSIKPAEQSGCGACSTTSPSGGADPLACALGASLLALVALRRRSGP